MKKNAFRVKIGIKIRGINESVVRWILFHRFLCLLATRCSQASSHVSRFSHVISRFIKRFQTLIIACVPTHLILSTSYLIISSRLPTLTPNDQSILNYKNSNKEIVNRKIDCSTLPLLINQSTYRPLFSYATSCHQIQQSFSINNNGIFNELWCHYFHRRSSQIKYND